MRTLNQRGFSIAEALIASGILAVVVAGVTTMVGGNTVSDVFRGRLQSNNSCLVEANRLMNNFKQKGLVRSRFNYPVPVSSTPLAAAATVTLATGVYTSAVEPGVALAHRWDTNLPIYGTPASGIYPLRPHMEIMGYMNALQAIYNSAKTTYCPASGNGATSYADSDGDSTNDLINGVSAAANLSSAAAYVKIQPFQTTDGALVACGSAPATLDIRPAHSATVLLNTSMKEPTSDFNTHTTPLPLMSYSGAGKNHPADADAQDRQVFSDAGAVENRGWAVTVTVTYKDRNNMDKQCSVQEKFQYSAQPSNIARFEFEDIDDVSSSTEWARANNMVDRNGSAAATLVPEKINGTVRSVNVAAGQAMAPIYPSTSGTVPSSPTPMAPTNTLFYGCSAGATYSQSINLRLKNVRPGSIMMCRNLSFLRQQPTFHSATVQSMDMSAFPQRTTFFSTELLQNSYFSALDNGDTTAVYGDNQVMGLYYPRNDTSGDYYCREADGCYDLPRFSYGYAGTSPAGGVNQDVNPSDTVNLGTGANRVRHFPPYSGNARGATASGLRNFDGASTALTWAPCETINVCDDTSTGGSAHGPTFAGFVPGNRSDGNSNNANDADAYHLKFDNLPVGCEVHIQMAEVDAGYNVQATDFREYIHEKVPGNKLCRAGDTTSAAIGHIPGHNNYEWFFSCGATNPIVTNGPTPGLAAPHCRTVGGDVKTPCCVDFPFYPEHRATYDPSP